MKLKLIVLLLLLNFICFTSWAGVNFDGTNDRIEAGIINIPAHNAAITVFALVKAKSWEKVGAQSNNIVQRWSNNEGKYGWGLIYDAGSDKIAFYSATSDGKGRGGFAAGHSLNEWHTLIGYTNGTNSTTLVVDGTSYTNSTDWPLAGSATVTTYIGGDGGGEAPFDGIITEVAIWDVVLTANEITLLINSKVKRMPLQIQPANLVGYWALDDHPNNDNADSANGFTFQDRSSNTNTGTATGCNAQSEQILSYP